MLKHVIPVMKPESISKRLQELLGANLQSIFLYGSAAAGDFQANGSDYNMLVVTQPITLTILQALASPAQAWIKEGNPPPLFLTEQDLKSSADVFPLELLDMQENHQVLYGRDVLKEMTVSLVNVRHQLEYELKSKLIRLREQYLIQCGNSKEVVQLMVGSISPVLVLFRGALRLFNEPVPSSKMEALRLLSARLYFPADAFETIQQLKTGAISAKSIQPDELFGLYLTRIETVVNYIDQHLRSSTP